MGAKFHEQRFGVHSIDTRRLTVGVLTRVIGHWFFPAPLRAFALPWVSRSISRVRRDSVKGRPGGAAAGRGNVLGDDRAPPAACTAELRDRAGAISPGSA